MPETLTRPSKFTEHFANFTLDEIQATMFDHMQALDARLAEMHEEALSGSNTYRRLLGKLEDVEYAWSGFRQAWSTWEFGEDRPAETWR